MTLEAAIEQFLLACRADGLRPATVKWYTSLLMNMAHQFPGLEAAEVTPVMLRRYIVTLRERTNRYAGAAQRPQVDGGLSDETIAAHVRGLHRFWKWTAAEYNLPNPMANVKRPRRKPPKPKGISMEDVAALLAAAGGDVGGIRDRAILVFLIDTGCRAQGLLNLTTDQLDLAGRSAIVLEKGSRSRAVFFTDYTAGLLMDWLAVRPAKAVTLFCSVAHNAYGKPLTHTGLYGLLRRLKTKAGIDGRFNPHAFRHGFAREYILMGGDLATLAQLMGHSTINTTASYYAVFNQDELSRQHNRFSPVNGLEKPSEDEV